MTREQAIDTLVSLRKRGFDGCKGKHVRQGEYTVRVGCSQCAAMSIQGMACHEPRCPNAKRRGRSSR